MVKRKREGTGRHSELGMRMCDPASDLWGSAPKSLMFFQVFLYPKSLYPGMDRGLGSAEAKSLLGPKDKMVTPELRFLSVGSQRESIGKGTSQLHL